MFRPLILAKHETAVYFASAHARSASQAMLGEPPHSGGESHGGIQNAVAFPCGNARPCARLRRARVVKSNRVEIVPENQNPLSQQSNLTSHVPRALYCKPTRYAPIALKHRPPPSTAATPKETAPCIFGFGGGGFVHSKNGKGVFFRGSAFQAGAARDSGPLRII